MERGKFVESPVLVFLGLFSAKLKSTSQGVVAAACNRAR
jgi:hypothetical protein